LKKRQTVAWRGARASGARHQCCESKSQSILDTVFRIGGALLSYSDDLSKSTSAFLGRIKEFFSERLAEPKDDFFSSCELPGSKAGDIRELMKFKPDFSWEGRESAAYKMSAEMPFKDVKRFELIGKQGENTAFDLRYFQVEPGGYSSKEKHNHTHVIIGVRGQGVLEFENHRLDINPNDVAYVQPMQVHQLKNETDEPFGFYCIVDHERDRPIQP